MVNEEMIRAIDAANEFAEKLSRMANEMAEAWNKIYDDLPDDAKESLSVGRI